MFRKILIFLFFLVLVTAKRFGISMINDIHYGQWRWEKRNNKTMLPSGGINGDGPYGRYRRPRSISNNNVNNVNNKIENDENLMKKNSLLKMLKKTKFDDYWSTDTDDYDFDLNKSMDNITERSYSAPSYSTPSYSTPSERSYSAPSYSTPSYSTYSYTTRSHHYHGWYWKNRIDTNNNYSTNNLYGEYKNNNSSSLSFSNKNESFSMPNLASLS